MPINVAFHRGVQMNPLLNTPEKIWLNCINISVQTNWADPAWIQKEYGAVVHPDVTFVLYRYGKDAGKREECGSITLNNGVLEGGFPKQDKYYDVKNRLTYTYTVEELPVGGYRNTAKGQDASGTQWTFTNEKIPTTTTSLVLYKVASTDNTLRLTGADGKPSFKGLAAGTYQLVETKAPEGYVLNKSVYEIVITEEQIIKAGEAARLAGKENGEIGCLITNKPGSGVEGGNPDNPNSLGDVVPLEGDVLGVELACQKTLESGVKGSGRNRPQTGAATPVAGYAMMAVLCGGIFVFYIRKRKKDHKKA